MIPRDQISVNLQNLYVSNLPKSLDDLTIRRIFARYGKISSIKVASKPQFATNVAYVGYFVHFNAARALKFAALEPELQTCTINFENSDTPVKLVKHRILLEG